jgi:hypothetical protein
MLFKENTMENKDFSLENRLIDLFWEGLEDYSSDVWFDSSTKEKEELLWWAISRIDEQVDQDFATELFWEWANGLEEDSFIDFEGLYENLTLTESYRRTVSRGNTLENNELFVDFDLGDLL